MGKRKQNYNQFFDYEADEGADSDEGIKHGAAAIKDAYYDDNELKRRNMGYDEYIQ